MKRPTQLASEIADFIAKQANEPDEAWWYYDIIEHMLSEWADPIIRERAEMRNRLVELEEIGDRSGKLYWRGSGELLAGK